MLTFCINVTKSSSRYIGFVTQSHTTTSSYYSDELISILRSECYETGKEKPRMEAAFYTRTFNFFSKFSKYEANNFPYWSQSDSAVTTKELANYV